MLGLSELQSEGLRYEDLAWDGPEPLRQGDRGERVSQLQFLLAVVGQFVQEVRSPAVDGIFGPGTRQAVISFQRYRNLPQTGEADQRTWDALYDEYLGIDSSVLQNQALFPQPQAGPTTAANARQRLQALGFRGSSLRQELLAFQQANRIPQTGQLGPLTADAIARQYAALGYSETSRMTQFPGTPLSAGSRDQIR